MAQRMPLNPSAVLFKSTLTNALVSFYVIFWIFLCTVFNSASSADPSVSTVSADAGIEPRTVATSALTVRRSNH